MHSRAFPFLRKLRFGKPIVVVSGLPRSGTSMTMRMLERAGLEIESDGVRTADESNPHGYYEFEKVKHLHSMSDSSWLLDARGKVLKIVSFFLPYLPRTINYEVLFMRRDLDEIISSQRKMLDQRGQVDPTPHHRMREHYEHHLRKIGYILAHRSCFRFMDVSYRDVVQNPQIEARRISQFLGGRLDIDDMVAAVDERLYRNRR